MLQPIGPNHRKSLEPDGGERQHGGGAQHRLVSSMPWQRQQRFDERATSVDGPTDHHVLEHRGAANDARRLERSRDPPMGARLARKRRQRRTVQPHGAALRYIVA